MSLGTILAVLATAESLAVAKSIVSDTRLASLAQIFENAQAVKIAQQENLGLSMTNLSGVVAL